MGGASSKAARKLPKRVETPTWAGSRTNPNSPKSPLPDIHRASETKDEAIEKDSRDPQFLSNLNRLGPVRVDHHMQSYRPDDHINRMYQTRAQSEAEATTSNATRNRILSSTLSDLLERRKNATSNKELEILANKNGMDLAKLESLSRFVNSPTIGEGTTVRVKDENEDELITSTAVWMEPPFIKDSSRISSSSAS